MTLTDAKTSCKIIKFIYVFLWLQHLLINLYVFQSPDLFCWMRNVFLCFFPGCGKSTGAELLGVDSEPWVFKGGVSGEVQVALAILSTVLFYLLFLSHSAFIFFKFSPKPFQLLCVFAVVWPDAPPGRQQQWTFHSSPSSLSYLSSLQHQALSQQRQGRRWVIVCRLN